MVYALFTYPQSSYSFEDQVLMTNSGYKEPWEQSYVKS